MDRITGLLPFSDSSGKISFKAMFSYIFDYAIIIALAIAYAAIDKIVTPFSQRFSLNDISIQYPFATEERIPIKEAVLISGAFPIVAIAVYTMVVDGLFSHSQQKGFKKYTFKQRLWELNCGILGLLLAQGAAFCITGTLKNLIGRPRPDMISRCGPDLAKYETLPKYALVSRQEICTRAYDAIMQDAFRSFPSGHSSSSFAGLGYLSLYLMGKLHVLDQRGEVWRTVIIVIPVLAASCIAASRIMDYRHHPFDVLFGSALGLICAWAAYRQYFPPLSQVWMKGRAYPMREWGVPIKRPEDPHGAMAGYSSGRPLGPTSNLTSRHGPAEELPFYNQYSRDQPEEHHQMYTMDPIPAQRQQQHMHMHIRQELPSPGLESVPAGGDDTDYEVIRSKAQGGHGHGQGLSQLQSHHLPPRISSRPRVSSESGSASPNVFRDQVERNQSLRRPGDVGGAAAAASDDEEDLGVVGGGGGVKRGERGLLVGSGNGQRL